MKSTQLFLSIILISNTYSRSLIPSRDKSAEVTEKNLATPWMPSLIEAHHQFEINHEKALTGRKIYFQDDKNKEKVLYKEESRESIHNNPVSATPWP